jgi:hypothetical protein
LPLEDAEREGAPQHLQDEPGQLLRLSTSMCGRNAIFSQYGTYPSWSPYKAFTISQAITHDQGNVFSNNTYLGTWNFMPLDTGHLISPSAWKASPYNQDAGTSFTG